MRHLGRGIVWATRAVKRRALVERVHVLLLSLLAFKPRDDGADARRPTFFADDFGKREGNVTRLEIEHRSDQVLVVTAKLSVDARPFRRVHVEENGFDLRLDEVALFLDNVKLLEAIGEARDVCRLERPGH